MFKAGDKKFSGNAFLLAAIAGISIIATAISFRLGLSTIYNDGMSHLDISRLVFDYIEPGFSQLGSVWLPLSHVLNLAFVWNDTLWHTGLAGSLISMAAFVAGTVGVWKIVKELTPRKSAAIIAGAAFALNINMLYLQSTPLTEPLYVVLYIFSGLYMVRYLKSGRSINLLPLSLFTSLQMLTRYDGWFVAVIEGLVILIYEFYVRKQTFRSTIGNFTLFATPVAFSALLWFGWNALIFHDPLYFAVGPYSAHAQQSALQHSGGLITKGNVIISAKAYYYDIIDNLGIYAVIVGMLGWVVWVVRSKQFIYAVKLFIVAAMSAAIVFNVLALVLGFSIINVPELNWNPSGNQTGSLFNVRYGIMALPFVAVGFGLLASYLKKASVLLYALIVLQGFLLFHAGVITVQDGQFGSSSFANSDIATAIHKRVGKEDRVIMSTSFFNAVAFKSDLDLKRFIHEGVSGQWSEAKSHPDRYAKWIVAANGDVGEPVYTSLVKEEHSAFLATYKMVYQGAHANLFERKTPQETFAAVSGQTLHVQHNSLIIKGFSSYDLAYRSDKEIDLTFATLKANNISTIRFWAFGDGRPDGFQPTAGTINPERLKAMDYILAAANRYDMRVIPVLVNNWDDYGGAKQYLKWAGLSPDDRNSFYTNSQVISLYENYVNHIITRKNQDTNMAYGDDPAILSWELMNEPRATAGNETLIKTWADKVGGFIKARDHNHLVTIGTDKEITDIAGPGICASGAIDYCSVHIYLEDKGRAYYGDISQVDATLLKYKEQAAKIGKPIIVGEIGVSKSTNPFGQPPLEILGHLLASSEKDGYSGWVIWNWSLVPDSSFGFTPSTDLYNSQEIRMLSMKSTQQ